MGVMVIITIIIITVPKNLKSNSVNETGILVTKT